MKKNIYHYILIIFLIACSSNLPDGSFPFSVSFEIDNIPHQHLTDSQHISLKPEIFIQDIAIYDSLLIINGRSTINDYKLHVYNKNSGKLLNSFASIGRGPYEFLYIGEVQILSQRRELYFFDINKRISVTYILDSILAHNVKPKEQKSFGEVDLLMRLRLNESNYLCDPGIVSNASVNGTYNMLAKYSTEKKSITKSVSFPPLESTDSSKIGKYMSGIFPISLARLKYNEATGSIILAHSRTDLIELFDVDLNLILRIHGPDQFLPIFLFSRARSFQGEVNDENTWSLPKSPRDQLIIPNNISRHGYGVINAFDNGFYAMYSGELVGVKSIYKCLFFFKYNGEPLVRYSFSHETSGRYAVDQKNGELYLVNLAGELYKYRLSLPH